MLLCNMTEHADAIILSLTCSDSHNQPISHQCLTNCELTSYFLDTQRYHRIRVYHGVCEEYDRQLIRNGISFTGFHASSSPIRFHHAHSQSAHLCLFQQSLRPTYHPQALQALFPEHSTCGEGF